MLPAYVLDHCFDILAHNAAATAMFGDGFGRVRRLQRGPAAVPGPGHPPRAAVLGADRPRDRRRPARQRGQVPRRPAPAGGDRPTARRQHRDFAAWWGDHTVGERSSGVKRVAHPAAGVLTVAYDMLSAPDASEQRLVVLTPVGAETEQRLRALVAAYSRRVAERVGGLTRARSARAVRQCANANLPVHRRRRPVGHQARQRPLPLRHVPRPRRFQLLARHRAVGVPQHREQPPARLAVGPLVGLPAPRRTVVCGLPGRDPRAQ